MTGIGVEHVEASARKAPAGEVKRTILHFHLAHSFCEEIRYLKDRTQSKRVRREVRVNSAPKVLTEKGVEEGLSHRPTQVTLTSAPLPPARVEEPSLGFGERKSTFLAPARRGGDACNSVSIARSPP